MEEYNDLSTYIDALEEMADQLSRKLIKAQEVNRELYKEHIRLLEKVYSIGDEDVSKDIS